MAECSPKRKEKKIWYGSTSNKALCGTRYRRQPNLFQAHRRFLSSLGFTPQHLPLANLWGNYRNLPSHPCSLLFRFAGGCIGVVALISVPGQSDAARDSLQVVSNLLLPAWRSVIPPLPRNGMRSAACWKPHHYS